MMPLLCTFQNSNRVTTRDMYSTIPSNNVLSRACLMDLPVLQRLLSCSHLHAIKSPVNVASFARSLALFQCTESRVLWPNDRRRLLSPSVYMAARVRGLTIDYFRSASINGSQDATLMPLNHNSLTLLSEIRTELTSLLSFLRSPPPSTIAIIAALSLYTNPKPRLVRSLRTGFDWHG